MGCLVSKDYVQQEWLQKLILLLFVSAVVNSSSGLSGSKRHSQAKHNHKKHVGLAAGEPGVKCLIHFEGVMTESYIFLCHKYEPCSDGTVSRYVLEVTNKVSGLTEEIAVKPRELVSLTAMKRILVGRKIIYSSTTGEHKEMLGKLFSTPPCAI